MLVRKKNTGAYQRRGREASRDSEGVVELSTRTVWLISASPLSAARLKKRESCLSRVKSYMYSLSPPVHLTRIVTFSRWQGETNLTKCQHQQSDGHFCYLWILLSVQFPGSRQTVPGHTRVESVVSGRSGKALCPVGDTAITSNFAHSTRLFLSLQTGSSRQWDTFIFDIRRRFRSDYLPRHYS